ncbi:MAG: RidA family protein [Solobacterium sp.]|nr:RidA family protein [Solobacterium sp.]
MKEAICANNAPKAIGPYSPAIKIGDFIYVSGQLPILPDSGEIVEGGIDAQAKQSLNNIQAILEEVGLTMDHIVKTNIFMTDLSEFGIVNEIYGSYFNEPYPARSTVQVAALPKNAKIEIEVYAIDTLALEVICKEDCNENTCCCKEE